MDNKGIIVIALRYNERNMEAIRQYIDFYSEVRDVIAARSCAEMNVQREDALRTFSAQGFPSSRVERYRYAKVEADFSPN